MMNTNLDENRCFLFPIDPHMIFAYWDFSAVTIEDIENKSKQLQLVLYKDAQEYRRLDLPSHARNYYMREVESDSAYTISLVSSKKGEQEIIGSSNPCKTPPDRQSLSGEVKMVDVNELRAAAQNTIAKEKKQREEGAAAAAYSYESPAHMEDIVPEKKTPVYLDPQQDEAFNAISYPKRPDYSKKQ